jgi:hypothetical protein
MYQVNGVKIYVNGQCRIIPNQATIPRLSGKTYHAKIFSSGNIYTSENKIEFS